jgi:hypothetical protein
VRRVFQEYAGGRSPRAIARRLNAEGVPGPGGRPWGDTTIRGHVLRGTGLLHNELYVGRLVWNRQRYVKDPKTGRRVARLNPKGVWVIQEVPALRIVDDELWQAVQTRLAATRDSPGVSKAIATEFWKHRQARHLLTGLAHCGVCGKALAAVGRDYLACGAARRQGMCSNRRAIRRALLESVILDALRLRLMQPDLVAEFAEAYQQEVNRQRAGADAARERTVRELTQVKRKLAGLVDAISCGLRAPSLQQTLDDLEKRRAELTKQLAEAPAPLPRLHPNLAEVYRRKVAELGAALRDPAHGTEALTILRSLIDRVTLRPADDHFDIELEGALAGMLMLANSGNNGQRG